MDIEVYIITWNREDSIHLTINYYKKFCSKIVIFDNFSTDNTRDIATALGCEVRLFGKEGLLDDGEYLKIKNGCWKGSYADWVIVVDDDEILYNEDLLFILKQARLNGETIFKPQGFSVHSDEMPKKSWLEIQQGHKDENYSKLCVFNPKAITAINYVYGCHEARPEGRLVWGRNKLYLLHYRSVGGVERLIARHKEYVKRFSPINLKWGLGSHYKELEEIKKRQWKDGLEKSVPFIKAGILSYQERLPDLQKNV